MSDVVIRPTEESDLPRISDLTERVFGKRRDPALLGWLLRWPQRIDSWMAERHGEVRGHVAILKSRYRVGDRWLTGAHAFLWMVEEGHRGRAGVRLGRLIGSYRDFQIILGGTATTRAILSGRRFAQVVGAEEYAVEGLAGERNGSLVLDPVRGWDEDRSRPPGSPAGPSTAVVNEAAADHLEWLAACPDLEAHRFVLRRDGDDLGPVLFYVNRRTSPVAGRLVHLPFLAEEDDWHSALVLAGREFERLGCRTWTLLATHPALVDACRTAGATQTASRPVWIREQQETLASHRGAWHLTYLEGDLAYRRVESPRSES